jgi:hypothetical protein
MILLEILGSCWILDINIDISDFVIIPDLCKGSTNCLRILVYICLDHPRNWAKGRRQEAEGQEGRRQEGRRAGGQEGRRAGGQEGRRAGGQEGRRREIGD